jgi:putative hydrolase of the HAD superfamily
MRVSNIIFDLGGVLLNLDFNRTFQAFEQLGIQDFGRFFQQSFSNPLFAALETGACTPGEFYDGFRKETGLALTNEQIAEAWNAMLLDFRPESMAYLFSLKGKYRIFLLSNTNQIHLEAFRDIHFRQYGNHGFDNHFEKAWYSHELGLRKPNVECYAEVLNRHELAAGETLFVDDTAMNIEGAEKLGIGTLLLEKTGRIEQVMPSLLG